MIGGLREKQMQMIGRKLSDSEQIQHVCHIFATLERQQLERVVALEDALEIDHLDEELPDLEEREEQIQDVITAALTGGVGEFWLEQLDVVTTDGLEELLGLGSDSEEWREWIAARADRYRDAVNVDGTDRELVDELARSKWGLSIGDLERQVVDFDAGDATKAIVTRNFDAARTGIDLAIDEIEEAEEL